MERSWWKNMAKKTVKFELNSSGVKDLLNSEEMRDTLSNTADSVLQAVGKDGYEKGGVYSGRNRPNIAVFASTYQAKKDNLQNNTLERAMNQVKTND